ncbi:LLM class flavin-dependent oxidoreductase [Gemmobacter sp.]|uniref:LLM class flavin-dependent oxidoreductase n=1 Tax=Gemmobacter sp. TaxID=1898957 RepID=UPI002AFF07FD|nr:LLM class flavin-dependent oxidoreductase [Gemmobacter sp.]
MLFSYFSNADNTYPGNPRTPNDLILQIVDQAIFAERIGMHGAWVGEHHFHEFGVNASPEIVLAHIAARTSRIRLMPAVTVLPLHHPLRVAENWATLDLLSNGRVDFALGRGFDKNEYDRFQVDFERNSDIMREGLEIVQRAWTETGRWSHHGEFYRFEDVDIVPRPVQPRVPIYVACFSRPTVDMAAAMGHGMSIAPFAAGMAFGGVDKMIDYYRTTCEANGHRPGMVNSSIFLHFADTPEQERAARERQIRFFKEISAPTMKTAARAKTSSYDYWADMARKVDAMRPEDLVSGNVLLGSPQGMVDAVGRFADMGIGELGLYVNIGMKDPQQTKDEMQRFMEEVAPHFAGKVQLAPAAE